MSVEPKPEDAAYATLIEVSPSNPFRPLDWRMRLAIARVEHPRVRRSRELDDPWVRRAVGHLRAARPRGRRAGHDPAIQAASGLVVGAPRLRQELEARLIAGQGDAEIAVKLGLEPEVVGDYAALHYDIRPLLRSRDSLLYRAVGGALGERRLDRPGLLKLLAIGMGPLAVEVLADHLLGPLDGRSSRLPDPHLAETVELLLAMRNLPIDERTAPRIGALHARQQELGRARESESASAVKRPVLSGVDLARRMRAACAPIDRNPACGAAEEGDGSGMAEPAQSSGNDVVAVPRSA